MTTRPDFIDNRNGNDLARALGNILNVKADREAAESNAPLEEVCIATAFFSPTGFGLIADRLQSVPAVRLLIGADFSVNAAGGRKKPDETPAAFEQRRMASGLRRMDDALRQERDHLRFTLANAHALGKLVAALRAGNMEVRRYEKSFMHAKAYIFAASDGAYGKPSVIVGSSNLTGAGLTQNLELNLARYERPVVAQAKQWFDDLWNEAEPYDLAAIFETALEPRKPWEIFVRTLWQLYGKEVEEDQATDDNLPLTSFQKHGAARALRLIEELGGVIVADEVGLGKTFIAGEILQLYRSRHQRALLICPASLRDSTWKRFLNNYQLFAECLSFEQLAKAVRLRLPGTQNSGGMQLQRPLEEYQLVIVDEAHNYRNPDAPTRAGTLRRLMFGQKRDLLLLTATPVNNSLWDLYHLLRFFLRQDTHLAGRGILSIRERFDHAMREDPSSLSPDVLYPVIDATTVKRTRQFVKKHYANDTISGPDGIPRPIVFPQPTALSVRYNLDDLLPGFFDRLERALDPNDSGSILFARYMPQVYLLEQDNEENARASTLAGLLRSGLLKRFESSAYAFRRTVRKMMREHDLFLDALDAGYVVTTAFMKELSADDDAVFEDVLGRTEHQNDAMLYDTECLRAAVERDRLILRELAERAETITPVRDTKLQALANALAEIAEQTEREASDAYDETQKRKVLVFSFFEDTVKWIYDYLESEIKRREALRPYRCRVAVVSGSDSLGPVSREAAVLGFAPASMEAPAGKNDDRYDILITTDILAEGVNLQQCRNIINFDMPWNPMRLVQRHGRIDRIGSPYRRVFMRTIFPVDRLDRLLKLEKRILDKLAMAAASVGVAAPIEGGAYGAQVFTETREEIEKLLANDPSLYERGGTAGAAQTGEEYRQTLRKALAEDRERILRMPWKSGSGMTAGARRGVFFCAVIARESSFERTCLRFVAAADDWSPLTDENTIQDEVGACLRLVECTPDTPTWYPDALRERVYDFWEAARDHILTAWMRETDPANLQPAIRRLNHRVAGFIRANVPLGMGEERVMRALDILESPWPRREETMLRGWFETSGHKGQTLSRFLVERIIETGLEPAEPPLPLPPISLEDIELLCWIGIEPQRPSNITHETNRVK